MLPLAMTADDIIDGCGGTSALASALGRTPSTVSSWKTANFIPEWWQDRVLQEAARAGFPMVLADFPPKAGRKSAGTDQAEAA